MIRQFDLSVDEERVEEMLNAPHLTPRKLHVSCSETGYTTLLAHFDTLEEPTRRKRRRRMRRFLLLNGFNADMDEILENPNIILLRKFEFFSEQGVIIVLDHELKEW